MWYDMQYFHFEAQNFLQINNAYYILDWTCGQHSVSNSLVYTTSIYIFWCVVPEQSGLCGNFRVEGEEKCDPGTSGDDDPCCTSGCVLRKDARCRLV